MKKVLKSIVGYLLEILGMMSEFMYQVAYVGFAISAILIFFNILPTKHAIIYCIAVVLHFASLGYFGYMKDYYSGNWQKKVAIAFIITNILICIITAILTNFLLTIGLVLFMVFIAIVYLRLNDHLICFTLGKRPKLEVLFSKYPNISYIMLLLLPIIAIIIPLVFLPWNIFVKILIVIVYILCMPLIALATDEGFDIEEIFYWD